MKYILFLWLLCAGNCYAQQTSVTPTQQHFLYTNASNEVNSLWKEISFVAHSSFMPKDVSDQWPVLERIHKHTSFICTEFYTSTEQDSVVLFAIDSLIKEYSLLSKDLAAGINQSVNAAEFSDEKTGELLLLVLLQNEKNMLTNAGKRLKTANKDPLQLISYTVNSSTQYVAESGWYIATIEVQSFGIDLSKVKVFVEDKELPVVNGIAELKFKPTYKGGKYWKDGMYEKKWSGKIIVQAEKELIFPIGQTYYTARAEVMLMTPSVNALYKDCANEMAIYVPALAAAYTPRFEISNPEKNRLLISKEHPGMITIIPDDKKVEIKVYNDSLFIGSFIFVVRFIPTPHMELTIAGAGRYVAAHQILKKQLLKQRITASLKSDESFYTFLPKDASFYARTVTVTILRDGKVIGQEEVKAKDEQINFLLSASLYEKLLTNDSVKITATNLVRKTFENKQIDFTPVNEVSFEFIVTE
jgi:hypothetical protein